MADGAHPDRRRRGQPALGPREGPAPGRLRGDRGQGRRQPPSAPSRPSRSTSCSSTSACRAWTGSPRSRKLRELRPTRLVVDDRARHHGDRHPGDAARRLRLPRQAVRPRRGRCCSPSARSTAARLTQEVARLKSGLQEVWEFGALIGRHPRMQDVYKTIGRIAAPTSPCCCAASRAPARSWSRARIHHYSRRAGRPFVAVSAAAIPGTLLESELFGHERGAFTDAKERRLGKLELAHGGTLFLDEIGDMPPSSRRSSCARCRSARSSASAATSRSGSTCACSPRPTAISRR